MIEIIALGMTTGLFISGVSMGKLACQTDYAFHICPELSFRRVLLLLIIAIHYYYLLRYRLHNQTRLDDDQRGPEEDKND